MMIQPAMTEDSRTVFVTRVRRRRAFTLVEMLIAMAITLLMMAAIAKSFAFVGERIRDSRATLQLSSELRNFTTRLSDELNRCTVTLQPNVGGPDQAGYFMYYEGPLTDATSSLFRAAVDTAGTLDLPDSRYGDLDDYLAFTAVATPGSWFTGKVPRYLLDEKSEQVAGRTYTLPAGPYDDDITTAAPFDPFQPVTIRSKYAEIVYFVSPEYSPVSLLSRNPTYVDIDGNADLDGVSGLVQNGIPDRLFLHRRVLLVRPDLNLAAGQLPVQINGATRFMQPDNWPAGNSSTINAAAAAVPGLLGDAWLYGMAAVHQQCDLSVRRVLGSNGQPVNLVAANSLEDLAKPHNRFAHVRVPGAVFGGTNDQTSMPFLALGSVPTLFNALTTVGGPTRVAPPASPAAGAAVVTPSGLSGFLHPAFVLGNDALHFDQPLDGWGLERAGEDLVTNNVVAFDLKIYDRQSVSFTTSGGLVVGPGDAGYREAVIEAISNTTTSANRGEVRGGYVDLAYAALAGGPLRGWQARRVQSLNNADSPAVNNTGNYLTAPEFSGIDTLGASPSQVYVNSLFRSGKLLIANNSIRLFQPTFDTFTSYYEQDPLLQARSSLTDEGARWPTIVDPTTISPFYGRDGLDSIGIYTPGGAGFNDGNVDDIGEHETLPPFLTRPESIQVNLRLESPVTRQLRQSTVVHRDVAN